jgi:hypothetical protein
MRDCELGCGKGERWAGVKVGLGLILRGRGRGRGS